MITAGEGDDVVTASGGSSNIDIRSLSGGAGNDKLRIISSGNVVLPAFSEFEEIFVSDTVHQSLDLSLSSSLTEVELDSGTTIDNATITIKIGAGQKVILDSIIDGDTASASLSDGSSLL